MTPLSKLHPVYSMHLRGFDDRGAAAAMHSATASSFVVEGVFRDAADFAVLMVFDADDFYAHPRFKYLPHFLLVNVVWTFDYKYTNLRDLASTYYPSIDWPYLDVRRTDGTTAQIRLSTYFIAGAAAGWQRVQIDFTARGIDDVRQMWMTFAPDPAPGVAYAGAEWKAEFSNWGVTDPSSNCVLKVAGPGSVRVDSRDGWTRYSGSSWVEEASNQTGGTGFFNHGFARRAVTAADRVTIEYSCQSTHDLYVGTSLYTDRGIVSVTLDGVALSNLDCYLDTLSPVVTRRRLSASVAAGSHQVVITLSGSKNASSLNYYFYFDYLEAAVLSDAPAALPANATTTAALDYDTQHSYQKPAAWIAWAMEQLGFAGRVNLYMGFLWWSQRTNTTRVIPVATVTIPGWAVVAGDNVFVDIGGSVFGYFVLGGDTPAIVAAGVATSINATAVGVWASSSGADLIITSRSATYSFTLAAWNEHPAGVGHNTISYTGSLTGGTVGTWDLDSVATPCLNIAATKWLADLLAECAARSLEIVVAYSMELLNPPAAWAARFNDGSAVTTASGFGSNYSTHCTFGQAGILAYQQAVFLETAAAMDAAGLDIRLQAGEFVWWFFAGGSPVSMAFYDAACTADALVALGHALTVFTSPNEDFSGHTADANFLRDRLVTHLGDIRTYVQGTYATARIELLLPLDVTYSTPFGLYGIGGQLNNRVSLPAVFLAPGTAPFDDLKIEMLDAGASTRSYDAALWAIRWGFTVGTWPKADTQYLLPIYNGGCPWEREYLATAREGLSGAVLFAFDHVCLLNWPALPVESARALVA